MRLSEATTALAHQLRTAPGRMAAIATRLQDASLISKTAGSRRYPDDASAQDIVTLFIAAVAETAVGTADQAATTFASLEAADGVKFETAIHDVLYGNLPAADIAIRLNPPGASITFDDDLAVGFGSPETEATSMTRFIPSTAVAAFRAALQKEPAE